MQRPPLYFQYYMTCNRILEKPSCNLVLSVALICKGVIGSCCSPHLLELPGCHGSALRLIMVDF